MIQHNNNNNNDYKILGVIPARSGSKGVPKKNLAKIGSYSLVERALFTAINCKDIDDIIVTTDSKEVISLINYYGNFAPFERPLELSTDNSGSIGFLLHALQWAESNKNKKYEYIVLLEPTCPFRLPIHISKALSIARNKNASSVVSLIEVGDKHPIRIKKLASDGSVSGFCFDEPDGIRRQDQESAFVRNGAVYIFSTETIRDGKLWGKNQFGFVMDKSFYSINIDEPIDLLLARAFHKKCELDKILDKIEILI